MQNFFFFFGGEDRVQKLCIGEGFVLGEARGEETFKKGIKWLTGFENKLDFWNDKWTSFGPLRSIIQGLCLEK